jgi:hypothetical protein
MPATINLDRGQHPQEVRRGCKGLKPQQHTQGPLLQTQPMQHSRQLHHITNLHIHTR